MLTLETYVDLRRASSPVLPMTARGRCGERLRILSRHAPQRLARRGRNRATAICAFFLARNAFYTEGERAELAWTEAVTLVSQTHVLNEVYELARERFSDEEVVNLTMANRRHCWCLRFSLDQDPIFYQTVFSLGTTVASVSCRARSSSRPVMQVANHTDPAA